MTQRRHARSDSPYEESVGFSRAVRVGDVVRVAGTAPIEPDGSVDPDPAAQAHRCFDIILHALGEVGAHREDIVRTRMYLVDAADADAIGKVHGAVVGDLKPAATMVVVAALLDERWKVEIEVDAVCPS